MDAEKMEWFKNKIKGGVAESICRVHFESMGYKVEPFGIEHILPSLSSSATLVFDNYTSVAYKHIRKMPDFCVSRISPSVDAQSNSGSSVSTNTLSAFFVEAKYRAISSQKDLENLELELMIDYRNFIYEKDAVNMLEQLLEKVDGKLTGKLVNDALSLYKKNKYNYQKYKRSGILFYVVTKNRINESYVHLNYSQFPEWFTYSSLDDDWNVYHQTDGYLSFKQSYEDIVLPIIADISFRD